MTAVSPLLSVEGMCVAYRGRGLHAAPRRVLHEVSLYLRAGETLGLVGESGSGKSTIGRAITGLVPVESGQVTFAGERIDRAGARRRRQLGRDIQMVFQDPYTSLDPALAVGDTLTEPLLAQGMPARAARARVAGLLDQVGLPAGAARRLPREFSGGQRQRIAIARALAPGPRLLVCDEPVSALDLTTQRTVLDLLLEIQERSGVCYLFISHDLSVVRFISHRVAVLRDGHVVETGEVAAVTDSPRHPYTRELLLAAPVPDVDRQRDRRAALAGIRSGQGE